MITYFMTAEIDLKDSAVELQQAILETLCKQGEPLRWAITSVDPIRKTVQVEAVVTR